MDNLIEMTRRAFDPKKKGYHYYPTKEEALVALFRATRWDPSDYDAVFPTDDGRFVFSVDEAETFQLVDQCQEAGKVYFLATGDDDFLDTMYEKEVRMFFDQIVPREHSQYAELWDRHFDDMAGCANGIGGYCDAKNAAEFAVGWIRDCSAIWAEEVTRAAEKIYQGDKLKQAIENWSRKGNTPHELAGMSEREWNSLEIYTEDEYRKFIRGWIEEQMHKE